jgi:hypothetical protein
MLSGGWSDVTGFILDFQLAVIHSMRQLISYERVPDYVPNRSIRIPLTHGACEVCPSLEVTTRGTTGSRG